jgi:hypothetical protein
MAVYKIFPQQTSTLFSYYPSKNTGLDEILDISLYNSIQGTSEVSRALIQFPLSDIQDVISNKVSGSYDAYLKLYLADNSSIPLNYSIYCYPISSSWNMGTGRTGNSPETEDGVSWKWRYQLSSSAWTSGSYGTNVTASFISSNPGGGNWYYNLQSTQSFTFASSKDIELKVTNTVISWSNGYIDNNGFILKHDTNLEFTTSSYFETKYYSGNTHTIYPPCLEIRWDDSSYSTGSLSMITSDKIMATLGNNKGEYQQDSIQRFRVNVRDQYPVRMFQTSSVYLNNKVLPPSSYWSIIDLDSEERIIDYDTNYTKISADSSGNYFNIYMNGLQPERYYKVLIKSILSNGETLVLDNNYIFKVIK